MAKYLSSMSKNLYIHFSYRKKDFYLILFFISFGFVISCTQIFGESPDYAQYNDFFDLVRNTGLNILFESRFEPGFSILAIVLTKLIATNVIVYSWIVAAALMLKGLAINAYSSNKKIFIFVAVFYLARYFSLHELTQLRAACSIALMLISAIILWRGSFLLGILICALAVTFHLSSIAIIPALFLNSTKRWQALFIALLVFFSAYFFSDLITGYLGNVNSVFINYQSAGFGDIKPNPFAVQVIIDWVMIIFSLIVWNRLSSLMRRIVLLELIGVAIFYGVLEFSVIAHRIREFYSVFWVFFVADGLRQNNTKLVTFSFGFISILFYSYIFIFSKNFYY
jgi:hypothetical protein